MPFKRYVQWYRLNLHPAVLDPKSYAGPGV